MMQSFRFTILVLVLSCSLSGEVFSQISRIQYANLQYELNNFRLAADEFAKIYARKPDYTTSRMAALSLDKIYSFSESYEWWKKTVEYGEASKEDYASLIRAGYRYVQNYDPTSDLKNSPYRLKDFDEFARLANVNQVDSREYEIKSFEGLNSDASDYSLTGTKAKGLFFSSNRNEEGEVRKNSVRIDAKGSTFQKKFYKSDGKSYYGIYTLDSGGKFTKVQIDGYELYHLSDPRLLSNGKLIFVATPDKIKRKDAIVYPGLFYGTYDELTHTVKEVKSFPYNQTDQFGVISPGVDEEEKRLYFSSNRPGSLGGYDLYYVTWDDKFSFSEPVNLGTVINSPSNERDAFRVGDEFFFSSDRKGGFGGLDVYSSTVKGSSFAEVVNMGLPINSTADDFCFSKHSSSDSYLSSDRAGGKGFDDLYQIVFSDRSLKVFVVDAAGNSLRDGSDLQLIDGINSKDINSTDDKGLVELTKKGNTYTFSASRPGYFNQKLTATIARDKEEVTLVMAPIPYQLEVYQEVIYYDLDKDFLRDLSKEKLDEIVKWMLRYPELSLMIESHTDSRASDLYNQQLSERRAASVIKYLEEKGVQGDRVSSAWFSESKLVNDCGDDVPCPEDNHQLNRRSELKLIAFPDPKKSYELPSGSTMSDFQTSESAKNWFLRK